MSDIDRTRMIPLHIADQAVAACDAEIAKLRAEVQRLDTLCKQLMAQHSDISCENIMLRKAGDAMAEDLLKEFGRKEMLKYQPYQDWLAAKEGKQS
jgi:hypothetical protein